MHIGTSCSAREGGGLVTSFTSYWMSFWTELGGCNLFPRPALIMSRTILARHCAARSAWALLDVNLKTSFTEATLYNAGPIIVQYYVTPVCIHNFNRKLQGENQLQNHKQLAFIFPI